MFAKTISYIASTKWRRTRFIAYTGGIALSSFMWVPYITHPETRASYESPFNMSDLELHVPELNVIYRSYDSSSDEMDIYNRDDDMVVVHFMRQESTKPNLLDGFKDVHVFYGLRCDRHFVYGLRMLDRIERWSLLDLRSGLIRDFADKEQLNSTLEGMNIKVQPLLHKGAFFASHPMLPGIVEFFSKNILVIAMFTLIMFVVGWCLTLVPAILIAQLSFWDLWSLPGEPSAISADESQKDGFPPSRE